jgi:hypothetical protein
MVSLQFMIICLTETNVEWCKYGYQECFKDGFNKLFAASRHIFNSYYETSCTLIPGTDRRTRIVHLSGKDSTGADRWSYFTLLGKYVNMIIISCYRVCLRPPIDPHQQTIGDLQFFINTYHQE